MKKCHLLFSVMLTLALAACGGAGEQGPQGPEGKQGPQGLQGDAGSDGQPGRDGEGCYVVKKDADHGIVICPADGSSYVIYSPENLPKANGLPNGNGGYLYCNAGYFGSNCAACTCEHGTCNDGLNGNGSCACVAGYAGQNCEGMADNNGKVYKIVEIDDQTWMAENMAFENYDVTCKADDSDTDFVNKYGCLYTFEDAIKVCPSGWRLPSKEELEGLLDKAGENDEEQSANLRAQSWARGNDTLGFAAIPAGQWQASNDSYNYQNTYAYIWSGTSHPQNPLAAYYLAINSSNPTNKATVSYNTKSNALSVRCIKN